MCKISGKPVNMLRKVGGRMSTDRKNNITPHVSQWINDRLFNHIIHRNQPKFPQINCPISPLFEQLFYPVSTTPIIKTII